MDCEIPIEGGGIMSGLLSSCAQSLRNGGEMRPGSKEAVQIGGGGSPTGHNDCKGGNWALLECDIRCVFQCSASFACVAWCLPASYEPWSINGFMDCDLVLCEVFETLEILAWLLVVAAAELSLSSIRQWRRRKTPTITPIMQSSTIIPLKMPKVGVRNGLVGRGSGFTSNCLSGSFCVDISSVISSLLPFAFTAEMMAL